MAQTEPKITDRLSTLFATLREDVRSGRIGRPVSVRGFFELSADHGQLVTDLSRTATAAFELLGEAPVEVSTAGKIESGHVSLLAVGGSGTTAVLSVSVLRGRVPTADLLVIGSRGTLRYEGGANSPHLDLSTPPGRTPSPAELRIFRAIESSLRTKTTAPVESREGSER